MRVTGEAGRSCPATRNSASSECPLLLEQCYRLLFTFIFLRQSNENFDIPRLGDQFALPFWVSEILETLGLIFLSYQACIPCSDKVDDVARDPILALQTIRVSGGFRQNSLHQQALLLELQPVFQRTLKNIADDTPAARLSNRSGDELVSRCVDVIHLDS